MLDENVCFVIRYVSAREINHLCFFFFGAKSEKSLQEYYINVVLSRSDFFIVYIFSEQS